MIPYSINHCEFYKLTSESSGGALYLNMKNMDLIQIISSYFEECVAPKQGGAIFCDSKNTTTKMCCFSFCATLYYEHDWWGCASNLVSSVGSFTSHVSVFKCNPDNTNFQGHIAYSVSYGKNEIEHTNITECMSVSYEAYHVVYAEASSIKYSIGEFNNGYSTLYTRDSKSLTLDNCIFINNNDRDGAVSGTTPTTMRGCIFYHNNIDSKMKSLSLCSCKTSSSSFGTFISKDSNCETNFDKEPNPSKIEIECWNVCECSDQAASPYFSFGSIFS